MIPRSDQTSEDEPPDLDRLAFAAMMGQGGIDCWSSRCPWCDEPVTTTHGRRGLIFAESAHLAICSKRPPR